MKLKYYLRGLGIGIIITTIILMIAFMIHKPQMSDKEIIARATELGMVMKEDLLFDPSSETETTTEIETETTSGLETENTPVSTETAENKVTAESTEEDVPIAPDTENNVTAENYLLTVSSGEVCRNVCEDLQTHGIVDDAEAFRTYLAGVGFASSIVAGDYSIPYDLTYEEIYQILRSGPVQ